METETEVAGLPATLIVQQHQDLSAMFIEKVQTALRMSPQVLSYSVDAGYYKREAMKLKCGGVEISISLGDA